MARPRVAQELLHLLGKVGHVVVALLAVGVERIEHHVVGCRVELVPAQRRQHELRILDGRLRARQVGREERVLAGQHLVGDGGERPLVAARVQAHAAHLLERHVADGAAARRAEAAGIRERGQAEVRHLHLSLAVDQHVVRLDVQVEHLVLVGHLQRVRDGAEHGGRHVEREVVGVVAQQLREGDALDVLHNKVGRLALHLEVVHRDDVRVGEHGGRARLIQAGDVGERAHRRQVVVQVGGGVSVGCDSRGTMGRGG